MASKKIKKIYFSSFEDENMDGVMFTVYSFYLIETVNGNFFTIDYDDVNGKIRKLINKVGVEYKNIPPTNKEVEDSEEITPEEFEKLLEEEKNEN